MNRCMRRQARWLCLSAPPPHPCLLPCCSRPSAPHAAAHLAAALAQQRALAAARWPGDDVIEAAGLLQRRRRHGRSLPLRAGQCRAAPSCGQLLAYGQAVLPSSRLPAWPAHHAVPATARPTVPLTCGCRTSLTRWRSSGRSSSGGGTGGSSTPCMSVSSTAVRENVRYMAWCFDEAWPCRQRCQAAHPSSPRCPAHMRAPNPKRTPSPACLLPLPLTTLAVPPAKGGRAAGIQRHEAQPRGNKQAQLAPRKVLGRREGAAGDSMLVALLCCWPALRSAV